MDKLERVVRTHIADEYRRAVEMVRIADKMAGNSDSNDHWLIEKAKTQVSCAAALEVAVDIALNSPNAGLITAREHGWNTARFS